MAHHLIGLTLGIENDWPTAFETLMARGVPSVRWGGEEHTFEVQRVMHEPFAIREPTHYRLVIDRLAWWYTLPREWLKKAAMMDEVYLLNDPFTFQSMEKHTAYCAMIRLGLRIPVTWLLPTKVGPDNERYQDTARRYNRLFDLDEIGARIGYPMYMKPFDGGGWRGVCRVEDAGALRAAYDASGRTLMHLQASVEGGLFSRSLSIGPQTRIMRYRPERPLHDRYVPELPELDPATAHELDTIGKVINAFFRWEFNSCEAIVRDGQVWPIDFANACPDVALISLQAHFPWAMTALVRWSVFCAASGRRMAMDMNKREYFEIADRRDLDDAERLEAYRRLALDYFQAEAFEAFCEEQLGHLDEVAAEYFASEAFDELIVRTVQETFPPHEHEGFIAHYRALLRQGVAVRP